MTLTFGSLFAGIGGLDLGLERAGMTCRWQIEVDDYCRRVLMKHWPEVPKYGDIREVTGDELERVDLICGGFPCQDISIAGKQIGIDGARSGLWSEYVRLIRVVRPRFVLVENVPNLLALGMGRVLGDLAASGYDAEWDCLPAAAFGAPHRRDRLFVVADARCTGRATRGLRGRDAAPGKIFDVGIADRRARSHVADTNGEPMGWTAITRQECDHWRIEPPMGRVAHGIPGRVDRLRGLGNAVVPQVAEWIGRRIVEVAA